MKRFNTLILAAISTLTVLSSLLILAAPQTALADINSAKQAACAGITGTGNDCSSAAGKSADNILISVINILSLVVGIIAVIMIIIGGMRFILSGGDATL
jgi:hypothetical protein